MVLNCYIIIDGVIRLYRGHDSICHMSFDHTRTVATVLLAISVFDNIVSVHIDELLRYVIDSSLHGR